MSGPVTTALGLFIETQTWISDVIQKGKLQEESTVKIRGRVWDSNCIPKIVTPDMWYEIDFHYTIQCKV